MGEMRHEEAVEVLAAWVVDGCSAEESARVAGHVAECPECAAEAERYRRATGRLAAGASVQPPAGLRDAVLGAARSRRAPGTAVNAAAPALVPYAAQVTAMDDLLAGLSATEWGAPTDGHGAVWQVLAHLVRNDTALAADLGAARPRDVLAPVRAGPELRERWRGQAKAILRRVPELADPSGTEVRLVGARPARGPVRTALVQRMFETWIHADDIRAATGRPYEAPPGDDLHTIATLGSAALTPALAATGHDRPGRTLRLVLTGPGGGEWHVPLSPNTEPGPADVTITAGTEDFCRLLANRQSPSTFRHTAEGDAGVLADVLTIAATLGCE